MSISSTFNRIEKQTVTIDVKNIDGLPDASQITLTNTNPAALQVSAVGPPLSARSFDMVGNTVGAATVTFTCGAQHQSVDVTVTASPDMSSMTLTLGPIVPKF